MMKIAFLNRIQRSFNAQTVLNEPMGGTQSALIYLARELAKLGHEVFVFCNCEGLEGRFDGVEYLSLKKIISFSKTNALDYFIPVADEMALNLRIPAQQTICWLHNDYYFLKDELPDLREKMAKLLKSKADKLITLSQWHTQLLSEIFSIPQEHFFQTRNGVYWPYFESDYSQKRLPRLFYTSVPDRGLDILLKIFPKLKQIRPELELHLYTSFKVWGKSGEWDRQMAASLYEAARAQEGVFLHEPLTHWQLAKELQKGLLWLYPTHGAPETKFEAETSCIAAIEAQAAGLPAIATANGALPETILNKQTGLLIDGNPFDIDYQNQFLDIVLSLLEDNDKLSQLSQNARFRVEQEYTWKTIAEQWNEELFKNFSSTRMKLAPVQNAFVSPKISIVLTLEQDGSQPDVELFLKSLKKQSFKAFEVIICEKKSQLTFKEPELNLRYRSFEVESEYSQAILRNKALELVRGEWVLFVNDFEPFKPRDLEQFWFYYQDHKRKLIIIDDFIYGLPLSLAIQQRGFNSQNKSIEEDYTDMMSRFPCIHLKKYTESGTLDSE